VQFTDFMVIMVLTKTQSVSNCNFLHRMMINWFQDCKRMS